MNRLLLTIALAAADRVWTVTIPGVPPTPNGHASRLRDRIREKMEWRTWAGYAVIDAGVPYLDRARVIVTRYSTGQPDFDGTVGSLKPVIDSLKGHVIADDDPAHLSIAYRSARCRRVDARVTMEISAWTCPESRQDAQDGQGREEEGE